MQNSNTFRRHTNTSCCRTQIHFTGTDKYSIHAPRQLCLLQRNWNSCLRLSVFFIKLVSWVKPILIWTTKCNAKMQVGLIQRFCPGWQNATFWAFLWRVLCACLLLFTLRCTRCELGSSLEVSTLWIVAKVHFWWYLWSAWFNFGWRIISWDQ